MQVEGPPGGRGGGGRDQGSGSGTIFTDLHPDSALFYAPRNLAEKVKLGIFAQLQELKRLRVMSAGAGRLSEDQPITSAERLKPLGPTGPGEWTTVTK